MKIKTKRYTATEVCKILNLSRQTLSLYVLLGIAVPMKKNKENEFKKFSYSEVFWIKIVKILIGKGYSRKELKNIRQEVKNLVSEKTSMGRDEVRYLFFEDSGSITAIQERHYNKHHAPNLKLEETAQKIISAIIISVRAVRYFLNLKIKLVLSKDQGG